MASESPAPEPAQASTEDALEPVLEDTMMKLAATGVRSWPSRRQVIGEALQEAHRLGQAAGA